MDFQLTAEELEWLNKENEFKDASDDIELIKCGPRKKQKLLSIVEFPILLSEITVMAIPMIRGRNFIKAGAIVQVVHNASTISTKKGFWNKGSSKSSNSIQIFHRKSIIAKLPLETAAYIAPLMELNLVFQVLISAFLRDL